jgi:precorrin-2 dehydrogenase / sirohydrochlorin ferrochelatase
MPKPGTGDLPGAPWHSPCILPAGLVNLSHAHKYTEWCRSPLPGAAPASGPVKTYPIFAVIEDKPCLVVGGGAVGERKVLDLMAAGARVTVVSRALAPGLAALADEGKITYLQEDFREAQVEGMALVMAATDDPKVNAAVSAAAQVRAIWVNVADEPAYCTFIVPAQVRRGELTLAISTGGASPALARQLREELQQHFGPEYGPYLDLLKRVRARLLTERRAHPDNGPLFHRLVRSPLHEAVAQGNRARVLNILHEVLGSAISAPVLGELVSQAFKETEG